MRKHTLPAAMFFMLLAGTASGQSVPIKNPPPEFFAQQKAQQLRANQPMSKFDASKAVPYKIVSRTGNPGMLWITAQEADSFEKRAHTALKAAEDLYNESGVELIRVYLVTIPELADLGDYYQAVATYEAAKRTWRVFAHDGASFPEWKINITREWLDEFERVGSEDKIDKAALQDRLGRLYNIQPNWVEPIRPTEINMIPYMK